MKTQKQIEKMTMTEIVAYYNDATGKTTRNPFKSKPAAIETLTKLSLIKAEDKRCKWDSQLGRSRKEEVKPLREITFKGQLARFADGTRTIKDLARMFDWSTKYVKFQLRSLNRKMGYGFKVREQKVTVFPRPTFS